MTRNAYNLTQMLDRIWRMGDKDEMSIKHIGHGLASVITYGTWEKAADYSLPDYFDFDSDYVNEYRTNHLRKLIAPTWAKVIAMRDRLGTWEFIEVVDETKFGFIALDYLEASWLPYKADLKLSV